MSYKIITITGADGVGKTSQALLLNSVLEPSQQLAFPNSRHWTHDVIRDILAGRDSIIDSRVVRESKDAIPFQYLQAINRLVFKDEIAEGLKSHHWIMARYDVDAIAYGCAEGVPLDMSLQIVAQDIPSDVVIILDGNGFRAPDQHLDKNDADVNLQRRVREIYQAYAALYPEKCGWLNVDGFSHTTDRLVHKLYAVHLCICGFVENKLQQPITPRSPFEISRLMNIPL